MKSAVAIANGTAMRMAMNAVSTEPTSIAPMPSTAVLVSMGSPMFQISPVMKENPKSEKISKPRYRRNAAMRASTTREKSAPAVIEPRNTRSTRV